jgi:hypothetical protein
MPDSRATTSETSASVGGMGVRCHVGVDLWFHATCPTFLEVQSTTAFEPREVIALVDRHLILSQSSFADHEIKTAGDLPFHVFNKIVVLILEEGIPARDDSRCHG